ncbi:hypothetical protein [Enterococcus faecalis]|uniref:hypothetical protein n=1 Tax=Enterococcus faecalis TaxID=1351 RepID=UPI0025AF5537|nr:hypothetical protein [Enterococcus faecalis]MDN3185241.1 hypothetical protein [Enterococcus faecalis]
MDKNVDLKKVYQESRKFRVENQTKFERALEGAGFGLYPELTADSITKTDNSIKKRKKSN